MYTSKFPWSASLLQRISIVSVKNILWFGNKIVPVGFVVIQLTILEVSFMLGVLVLRLPREKARLLFPIFRLRIFGWPRLVFLLDFLHNLGRKALRKKSRKHRKERMIARQLHVVQSVLVFEDRFRIERIGSYGAMQLLPCSCEQHGEW